MGRVFEGAKKVDGVGLCQGRTLSKCVQRSLKVTHLNQPSPLAQGEDNYPYR